ncbi:glycosyltransferase [Oscillibacter valericigenes]|nr:glycosyltransferase [Oscillibacter valericigenes]
MSNCNTVLFTASTYSHIKNFHRPYLRAFQDLGWQVHVACGGAPASMPEADRLINLPFEKKMTAPANFRAQALLRRAMEEEGYALVCTHTSLAAFFTRRAAAGLSNPPPVVNMAHGYLFDDGTPFLKREILLTAERLTARCTDLLLTMNDWDFQAAQLYHLGRRVENIPGIGVDFTRFDAVTGADGAALRHELGLAPENVLLLYAAEFSKRKNQAVLIQGLARLPERVRLALPGQGALWEECRALARQLGVANRVIFPGQIGDMPRWYRAADAAVSASRSEGLPFNVMESMYCGLPIVVSAVKGHTDLIQEGESGLLYPFGDSGAFAAQMLRLLDEPGLAVRLGENAKQAVLPYALPTVLPRVMEQYLSVIPNPTRELAGKR